jgi:hypothetical protein
LLELLFVLFISWQIINTKRYIWFLKSW